MDPNGVAAAMPMPISQNSTAAAAAAAAAQILHQPMPGLLPQTPQPQQQQQFYNLDYFRNFTNLLPTDSSSSKGPISSSRTTTGIPAADLPVYAKVLNEFITADFQKDYDTLRSMTLLDDISILDRLFHYEPTFVLQSHFIDVLRDCYAHKYQDLWDKYPGLDHYMAFCLNFIVYRSWATFKEASGIMFSKLPAIGLNRPSSSLSLFKGSMKRKLNLVFNCGVANNSKQAKKSNDDDDTDMLYNHPFLKTRSYLDNTNLFELGKLINYCVPSEFAVFVSQFASNRLFKLIRQNEKESYDGIKITFRVPVLTHLKPRTTQKGEYNYVSLHDLTVLGRLLALYTGRTLEYETFNLGMRMDMSINDTRNKEINRKCDKNEKFDDKLYYTFISNFDCFGNNHNMINAKGYTNKVYYLDDCDESRSSSQITPEMINVCESNVETLRNYYNEYNCEFVLDEDDKSCSTPVENTAEKHKNTKPQEQPKN